MSTINFKQGFVRTSVAFLLCAIALMAGQTAWAQSNFGGIVGTVTDTTGADVPGAQVTLKNNETNAVVTTTSGGGGTFSFLNLTPGSYGVTIAHAGFKAFAQPQIDVTIGGTSRVNGALAPGDVSESVTVQETSVTQLDTDTSSLGGVVEGQQVVESPLNGRDVNNLLDFVPGVVPGPNTQGNTVANGGSGNFQAGGQTQAISYGDYQIGGGFSGQSIFFIDGVESNIPENNVNSLVPTQDSVQEFRVSTNNVTAEFGGFAGGVVQISTKQGTNKFHGNAYEYFRNTVLDASDYFSNHGGPNGGPLPRSALHQNQFGGNIGGPILKDKLFVFFSFERETLTSSGLDTTTVPTTAEVNGDFSALTAGATNAQNPTGQFLYNASTGTPYACNGVANVICPTQIDAVAQSILKLESPTPTNSALTNNFIKPAPIVGMQNQYDARVDYNLSKKDQLFARYTFWNPHNGPSDPFGDNTGAGPTGNTTTEAVVGDNHLFSSSTIADLRLSYLENYNYQVPLSNGFNQGSIDANYGTLQAQQVNGHQGLLPGLGVGYGVGAELSQLYWLNTAYSINGSVTKVAGRHTVKVGGIGRQIEWTSFANNQGLGINASSTFTACPTATCGALNGATGNALASFLLGIPSSVGITEVGETHSFLHSYGFYGVDTWQVSNKLTLNLGLRWEQPGSYSEVNNLDTVLQPNQATTLPNFVNPVTGVSSPTVGGLAFVASPQYGSRREEQLHWKLFSPREGFAYRIDNKTVMRGGYGINYLPAELTADGPGSSSINSAGTGIGNNVGQPLLTTVDNPFPNPINLPAGRSQAALNQLLGQGISSRIPKQAYGSAQQYNFGFERSLDKRSVLTVSYAGAKGTHLVLSQGYTGTGLNLDQLPDQYDAIGGTQPVLSATGAVITPGTGLFTAKANPYAGLLSAGTVLDQPTVYEGYLLKPYPQYGNVTQSVPRYGASSYNALQVSYKRTFVDNGIIQVAYTYAKLLSNTDNTSSFDDAQGGQGVVQDNTNLHNEWSLSLQDLTQNLVVNYGLDLPFGHGQQFLGHANGLVNAVVGGWRMAGITTLHSGVPIAFQTGGNQYTNYLGLFGAGPIRPNQVAGCNKNIGGSKQGKVNDWFNRSCFTLPGAFAFGNESRVDGKVRTSGAANWDLSASKVFKVYSRVTGKLSVEAFNLFNRSQFAAPDTGVTDGNPSTVGGVTTYSNFGVVTRQANPPRQLQLAARFTF